jgi:DnaK suppressor protein
MDDEKLAQYRDQLLVLQRETEQQLKETAATYAPVQLDTSMGRLSRGDAMQSQQLALEMKRRREQLMVRIESALARIREGTYGLCGRCRQPVSDQRLDAQPDVVLCIDCARTPGR